LKPVRIFRDALLAPPDGRWLLRSLLTYLLTFAGSIAVAGAAFGIVALSGIPIDSLEAPETREGAWGFLGAVFFAPIVETLLLVMALALLPERWGVVPRAVVAGLAFGGLHGMQAPMWFFGPAFAFFVFSCAYLTWRPLSFRHAFFAAALPHALVNLSALAMDAISG
jgi:hypothetical protein